MENIPNHIAIIPDGNRRWAKKHRIIAWRGVATGAERFEETAAFLFNHGVSYVTFWAGSEDNLTKRSKQEVNFLISLLRDWLVKISASNTFKKNKIRFRVIGRWDSILVKNKTTPELKKLIRKLEDETKNFSKNNLTFLFGYDGQREMTEAIQKISKNPTRKITSETVHAALWTNALPPVDLVIRTGGEPHWSAGFMMWHTADSQFYFTKTLWPDFKKQEVKEVLDDFSKRERRFGK
jgi:undecaprenyl diphosphate synthase